MTSKFIEPEFDPHYAMMLNAVGEYLDNIPEGQKDLTERDVHIVRCLIEFYDYDSSEIIDIMDDVVSYSEYLERKEEEERLNERH